MVSETYLYIEHFNRLLEKMAQKEAKCNVRLFSSKDSEGRKRLRRFALWCAISGLEPSDKLFEEVVERSSHYDEKAKRSVVNRFLQPESSSVYRKVVRSESERNALLENITSTSAIELHALRSSHSCGVQSSSTMNGTRWNATAATEKHVQEYRTNGNEGGLDPADLKVSKEDDLIRKVIHYLSSHQKSSHPNSVIPDPSLQLYLRVLDSHDSNHNPEDSISSPRSCSTFMKSSEGCTNSASAIECLSGINVSKLPLEVEAKDISPKNFQIESKVQSFGVQIGSTKVYSTPFGIPLKCMSARKPDNRGAYLIHCASNSLPKFTPIACNPIKLDQRISSRGEVPRITPKDAGSQISADLGRDASEKVMEDSLRISKEAPAPIAPMAPIDSNAFAQSLHLLEKHRKEIHHRGDKSFRLMIETEDRQRIPSLLNPCDLKGEPISSLKIFLGMDTRDEAVQSFNTWQNSGSVPVTPVHFQSSTPKFEGIMEKSPTYLFHSESSYPSSAITLPEKSPLSTDLLQFSEACSNCKFMDRFAEIRGKPISITPSQISSPYTPFFASDFLNEGCLK